MKKLVFAVVAFGMVLAYAEPKAVVESKTTLLRDALAPYVADGRLPGAVCIAYNDGVQETCCIGYADVAAKRPITADDVYMQCSQTKGFCGVTVAKLVEEGRLDLDDPVAKYLPEFKTLWILDGETNGVRTLRQAKNVLTVRMCLNHTGGFPFEICAKQREHRGGGWTGGAPLRCTAVIAANSPIMFEPGTQAQYSNTGIDIGAAVVEVITGMPWEDYLQQTVLDPLGMTSSTFWPTDKQLATKIEMYDCMAGGPARGREENPWQQRPYNDRHVFASAGAGLWTTANDQLKFYKMLMNLGVGDNGVRILKEETVRRMLTTSTRPAGLGGYSLGLNAQCVGVEDYWVGHGGAWGTFCSFNWKTRQLKLWAVQQNGQPRPWEAARDAAFDAFFKTKVDNSGINAYTGRTN